MAGRLTRKELHALLDDQLDEWGYGEVIPVDFGRLTLDVQIEHGEVAATIGERSMKRKRQLKQTTG